MNLPETATVEAFAKLARFKPGYVRELRAKGRLVLTEDFTLIRVQESLSRLEAERESGVLQTAPPAELSFADFALLLGVKPAYITELKAKGRLVLTEDRKRVRVAESQALIAETSTPTHLGVRQRHAKERLQGAAVDEPTSAGSDDGENFQVPSDPHSLRRAKAQADKEEALARKALREEQVELGELLVRDQALAVITESVVQLRSRLELLPPTLAPQLAAIADEDRVRVLLRDAIEQAMEELARKFGEVGKFK